MQVLQYQTVENEVSCEYIEKKSRFIVYVKPVSTEEEAWGLLSAGRWIRSAMGGAPFVTFSQQKDKIKIYVYLSFFRQIIGLQNFERRTHGTYQRTGF